MDSSEVILFTSKKKRFCLPSLLPSDATTPLRNGCLAATVLWRPVCADRPQRKLPVSTISQKENNVPLLIHQQKVPDL